MKVWADNCTGQNQDYALYRGLTINYFVPGHSQMAADSFHASIEQQIRKASSFSLINMTMIFISEYNICHCLYNCRSPVKLAL